MKKYTHFITEHGFWFGSLALLVSFVPYFILGDNSFITIHDHLDLSTAHIRMLMDYNAMFDYSQKLPIGEGVSRSFFFVPFDIRLIFYYFLPTFWAIVANNVFARVLGYIGMYLLLDKYVVREKSVFLQFVKVMLSIGFSLSCAYTDYSLSALGFPLIFYAFLNFNANRHVVFSYILLVIYCLYNHFELGGFFACCVIGMYILYLVIRQRSFPWRIIIPLVVMFSLFIIEYMPMIIGFFSSHGELSHRIEMYSTYSVTSALRGTLSLMAKSMYHVGLILALPTFFALVYVFWKSENEAKKKSAIYIVGFGFIAFVFFVVRLLHNISGLTIVQSFQFDRFYWMYPTLVCTACAFSCFWLHNRGKLEKFFAFLLLFVTAGSSVAFNGELRANCHYLLSSKRNIQSPSFKSFFASDLFDKIKADCQIKEWDTKVVCLGMFPSVVQYNRISTLDFYQSNYPLAYKHRFRKVIAKELEKDKQLLDYFDNWGNRCYLFSSELGQDYLWGKHRGGSVTHLDIDTGQLRDLGCDYLFSAVDIEDCDSLGLEFKGAYTTPSSFWNIRVYGVR